MSFITTAAADTSGLIKFGPYADWLAEEPVTLLFAENFYFVYAATLCSEMASALGRTQEAVAYTALASSVSALMVQSLFNAGIWDGGDGNMNAQAMALAIGLGGAATAPELPLTVAAMVKDAVNREYHPSGGVSSIRWTLQGFTAGNRTDIALQMALVPTSPSWAYMSTPDMPGTIWEAWTGTATKSDGSKNHPMFTGGIGVWLYDSALGLRFRHLVMASQTSSSNDNKKAHVTETLLSNQSFLGFDPRVTCGLTDDETLVAMSISKEILSGDVKFSLESILSRVKALGVLNSPSSQVSMIPVFSAIPDAAIVKALYSASGFRDAPQGRCTLDWQLSDDHSSFKLKATVPSGVRGRLSIPLEFIHTNMHHLSLKSNDKIMLTAKACFGSLSTINSCCESDPSRLILPGVVEGESIVLCEAKEHAILPRLASWADLENQGRLFYGEGLSSSQIRWGSGGLLVEVEYGEWIWEATE